MKTDQAIKISLACQVAQKAVEIMINTMPDLLLNAATAKGSLDNVYDHIRENIEPYFDAEDEQAIIDLICNIEKALNQTPTPVPVHPEISNILNKHLGEK